MNKFLNESPSSLARIAGWVYILVFVTGITALTLRTPVGAAAGALAGALYVIVTALFYFIFRAVSRTMSLLAAIISLAGIAAGPIEAMVPGAIPVNPLVFFGVYCGLLAYLIARSTFLPGFLSLLLAFASAGWLTFLRPSFALSLSPYIFAPGIIGEGALTLWLVLFGVDAQRWRAQREVALSKG